MLKFEDWVAYLEGQLAPEEAARMESALEAAGDEERELVAALRQVLNALATDRLLAPSPGALEAAVHAYRRAHSSGGLPAWTRSLQESLAKLVFDSFAHPEAAFAGARSASVARRVRFEANGIELDLLIEAMGDRLRLTGQLLQMRTEPAPLADARFVLTSAGRPEADGETDAHGEFSAVAGPGDLALHVAHDHALIVFTIPGRASESDGS